MRILDTIACLPCLSPGGAHFRGGDLGSDSGELPWPPLCLEQVWGIWRLCNRSPGFSGLCVCRWICCPCEPLHIQNWKVANPDGENHYRRVSTPTPDFRLSLQMDVGKKTKKHNKIHKIPRKVNFRLWGGGGSACFSWANAPSGGQIVEYKRIETNWRTPRKKQAYSRV